MFNLFLKFFAIALGILLIQSWAFASLPEAMEAQSSELSAEGQELLSYQIPSQCPNCVGMTGQPFVACIYACFGVPLANADQPEIESSEIQYAEVIQLPARCFDMPPAWFNNCVRQSLAQQILLPRLQLQDQ